MVFWYRIRNDFIGLFRKKFTQYIDTVVCNKMRDASALQLKKNIVVFFWILKKKQKTRKTRTYSFHRPRNESAFSIQLPIVGSDKSATLNTLLRNEF